MTHRDLRLIQRLPYQVRRYTMRKQKFGSFEISIAVRRGPAKERAGDGAFAKGGVIMASRNATGRNASANSHFPQHRNAPQCLVRHPLLWDLRMVVLLGWVAISGMSGFGVA